MQLSHKDFGRTWVSEAPGSGPLARPDIFYVPPEITAQIFRACIPPKDLVNHSEEEISHTPMFSGVCKWTPFDLAQVCRDWRSIAFRTRELWQSIAIIGPKRCHLHRAIIWIDNVGHYPIDIVLEQKSDSDEEREVIAELMSLFAVRVASWRLIAFTFFGPKPLTPSNLLVRCITTLAQEKNSILHHALFDFHPHPYDGAEEWEISSILEIFSALQKIPSLAALYWSAAFTPGLKFSRNLVHLDLDSPISIEDLIENVVRSPHLQYLYARNVTSTIVPIHNAFMRQDDDMDVDMENIPRVALPALLHLSIAFNQVDPAPFLDRLALPSLTFLELVGVNPEDLYVVRQLLQVSQCQLGAFLVDLSTPAPEADIMDWLQMEELQCVERLDIHADVTNDIVKMLHRPALHGPKAATGETYFPELKDLTLTLRIAGIDDRDLLRTLGSRFWTPFNEPGWQKELKTATVFLSPEDLTPRLKVYERMFRQGVELNQDGWRNYDSRKLEFLQLSELM
ncbi:hypothetical protein M413DRAFT_277493 [Hebeloma cylindrosporum]|uniref:Uncharacterized protein n=1 Tax=Hebeloma cylindrosporum TaxID=76867 RepID=A0A0C2Y8I0_HEBCY|nr:hypothetical protein M413DRAFT_277493 [Hebeloma cylindrosporum h7]